MCVRVYVRGVGFAKVLLRPRNSVCGSKIRVQNERSNTFIITKANNSSRERNEKERKHEGVWQGRRGVNGQVSRHVSHFLGCHEGASQVTGRVSGEAC